MTTARSDMYEERGYRPCGDRSKEEPGEAQGLRDKIVTPQALGEWCVCRRVSGDHGDGIPRALNLASDKSATMYAGIGEGPGLCFDILEPVFTCSEADAKAIAGPHHRMHDVEDIAVKCADVRWRTFMVCSLDSSLAHLYEGSDLAEAESWRKRALIVVGGRKVYPVKCIVEGEVLS